MRPVPDATGDRYTLQPIGHEVHLLGEKRGLNLARDDETQPTNMGVTDLGLSARPPQIRLRLEKVVARRIVFVLPSPINDGMIQIEMTPPAADGAQGSPDDSRRPSASASPEGCRAIPSNQET